jgi:hypothetical protein
MAAGDVFQPLSMDTLLTTPPLGCVVLTVLHCFLRLFSHKGITRVFYYMSLSCVRRQWLADQSLPMQLIPTDRFLCDGQGCSGASQSCVACAQVE